jgi:ATP-dependent DNA ligase
MRKTDRVKTPKVKARFIEPMLLLRTEKLPEGPEFITELKIDGYRALAIKSDGQVQRRSRNDNDLTVRYASLAKALAAMPDETVIDVRSSPSTETVNRLSTRW